jgi:hypothetical protein
LPTNVPTDPNVFEHVSGNTVSMYFFSWPNPTYNVDDPSHYITLYIIHNIYDIESITLFNQKICNGQFMYLYLSCNMYMYRYVQSLPDLEKLFVLWSLVLCKAKIKLHDILSICLYIDSIFTWIVTRPCDWTCITHKNNVRFVFISSPF